MRVRMSPWAWPLHVWKETPFMGWAHGQSREMLKMLQSPGRLSWSSLLQGCPALVNGSTPPSHQPRAASPGACAQHSFPPRAWGAGGGGREDSQGFQLLPMPHVGLLVPWCPAQDTKGEVRHPGEIVLVPQQAISGTACSSESGDANCRTGAESEAQGNHSPLPVGLGLSRLRG